MSRRRSRRSRARQDKDPADAAWDLVAQGNGRVMAIYHMMGEQDIETALRFPWTSIGSDAGAVAQLGVPDATGLPHPRSFGNFPRVIATLREGAQRAHADGSDPQDDRLARRRGCGSPIAERST